MILNVATQANLPPPDEVPITLARFSEQDPLGVVLFGNPSNASYHLLNVQSRLIELGALTKVGRKIYVFRSRFAEAWQQVQVEIAREQFQ
ncbi:hypothetical protein VVD49_15685 [Uliginosibacterium sp. H3]|uniref:Transcriptional regulator n=1 Tax=Uliginosibacterium silvisoli TaxID=3114758 RepID=A0ABU6K6F4_9RHOO|nr:hypothetical protein [Uliginosibacterium sp. H3]